MLRRVVHDIGRSSVAVGGQTPPQGAVQNEKLDWLWGQPKGGEALRCSGTREGHDEGTWWSWVVLSVVPCLPVLAAAQTVVGALAIDARQGDQYGWAVDFESASGDSNRGGLEREDP